ncbi:hypothetical protein L1887_11157 [Cichorium endivia]|nr:hypothetical protein L1887_11157 [Cichorium endivia]
MSEVSVNSPPPPPTPISESFRKYLLNMDKLTGLNYIDWLRQWKLVMRYERKPYLIECPLPCLPKHGITQQLRDAHDFLIDKSEEVRSLMLLTIDPAIHRDFEFLGPYELTLLVEERFQEPLRKERARIFEKLGMCRLKEGSSIGPHVL